MIVLVKTNSEKTRQFSQVQVINRAATILRTIRDSGGLTLSQLARNVGLARTTVYRIVATLESEGLLTTALANQSGVAVMGFRTSSKLTASVSQSPFR